MKKAILGFILQLAVALGCGVSAADHAANAGEAAQYSAELQACVDAAKPLPTPEARMAAYQTCACQVDAKHGVHNPGCP